MSIALTNLRSTVEEYEAMGESGQLTENDRVELIRGEIIEKMTINDRHVACVDRLNRILNRMADDDLMASIQNPIRLIDSQPEPDVVL